jgi:rubredoxin
MESENEPCAKRETFKLLIRAALSGSMPPIPKRGAFMQKWVCTVCGYVYDPAKGDPENGVPAGTPFENVPKDWVCPVCGASREDFEKTSD